MSSVADESITPAEARAAVWRYFLISGVLGILTGLVAVVWPGPTLTVFAVVWGTWAVLDGVLMAVDGLRAPGGRRLRTLALVTAAVALAAGLVAVLRPGTAVSVVTWALGLWLVVRGAFEVVGALASKDVTLRWLSLASAVASWVLGILMVLNPGRAAVGITVALGVVTLVWGVAHVAIAVLVRRTGPREAGRAAPA